MSDQVKDHTARLSLVAACVVAAGLFFFVNKQLEKEELLIKHLEQQVAVINGLHARLMVVEDFVKKVGQVAASVAPAIPATPAASAPTPAAAPEAPAVPAAK